jgi:hypothetical protein
MNKPCQCCGNADIHKVMFSVYVDCVASGERSGPYIRCLVCGSMRLSDGPKYGVGNFDAQIAAWNRHSEAK